MNTHPRRARARALLVALALSTPAPLLAQEPPDGTGSLRGEAPGSPPETRDALDLARILHLRGGTAFRGHARRVRDHWEIRTGGTWRALPAGTVERAVEESRVLAQAAHLREEAGSDQGLRRVALADWMAREGLVAEALTELDRVLTAQPDQPDALRLLAHPSRAMQVFGSVDAAEALLAQPPRTPSLRELALSRLDELEDRAITFERLRAELAAPSPARRAFAARGLGRLFPGEEVEPLLGRAVLDGSAEVRGEAARALGAAGDPALVLPVLRALESDYPGVRANAARALGAMAYPVAVEPLVARLGAISSRAGSSGSSGPYRSPGAVLFAGRQVAYLQDFDVEIANAASIADPQVGVLQEGAVLDVRVHGIHAEGFAVERRCIRDSLARLTGADPGDSAEDWLAWWEEHRDAWAPPREPAGAAPVGMR